ncbi:hypothetical protein OAS67_00835 [Alphaproteobacteria bacterium]|nr:hypothetical protein [Alphaproteobacteria bacterium]
MTIEILGHRGVWKNNEDKNSMSALCRALDNGFGIETDIRDFGGELIISHDLPTGSPIHLDEFLHYYRRGGYDSTIALNIKADGLQNKLRESLEKYFVSQYFVFDMSIPDSLGYLNEGIRTFIRRSELENHPELVHQSQGIWLDELTLPWIDKQVIIEVSKDVDTICIVSAELHRREHLDQWKTIRDAKASGGISSNMLLCTDFPNEAKEYF